MGNCLTSTSKVENAQSNPNSLSNRAKVEANRTSFSNASTLTAASTPSALTLRSSFDEKTTQVLPTPPRTEDEILSSSNLKSFTFNDLKSATRNFRPESLLGEGGFGHVYKGWIDAQNFTPSRPGSGIVVAVKKLKPEGYQGHKEWLTEVSYLGQLRHPNLVRLIGYCSEGEDRLLVYEFIPKGSLENHLFRRGTQPLPWVTRIKVAVGAARGLSFLHDSDNQVIYRDVKSSNILLDSEFNAKLSDFGLAKAGPTGDKTHVSTQVMGTQGYAAPEYIATGRLSAKADVYSFGVVLLELLSGKRALEKSKLGAEQTLVDWARPFLNDKRKLYLIMDGKLEAQYPKKAAHAVAVLALQCVHADAKLRPQMCDVLATLEKLQDSKASVVTTESDLQRSSSATPKTPTRNHRSSPRTAVGSSPRPSSQQSPRIP